MYDKDNDYFKLSVRDLNFGSLCSKPQADRVSNIAWAKNGQSLLYVVTNDKKRPFRLVLLILSLIMLVPDSIRSPEIKLTFDSLRIYCSMLDSNVEDVLLLEEPQENVHLNIRHTKDFQFLTVNVFSSQSSKVCLLECFASPLNS